MMIMNDPRWRRRWKHWWLQCMHANIQHHASWYMFGAVFRCTCKYKSFHVCSNRSSRIHFDRTLLICLCCYVLLLMSFSIFHFSRCFSWLYAVIFTHAMPTAFVKCQKKQIISMLDLILYEYVSVLRACCVYYMLTESIIFFNLLLFQWALSLFLFNISFHSGDDPYFAR